MVLIKINGKKSDTHFIWNDSILNLLNLPTNSRYSCQQIETEFKKKFSKRNMITFNLQEWKILKFGYNKPYKLRLSFLMNHLIKNFIIENDRPTSKFYSSDYDFNIL